MPINYRDGRLESSGRTGAVLKEDRVDDVAVDTGQRGFSSRGQGQRSNTRTDKYVYRIYCISFCVTNF